MKLKFTQISEFQSNQRSKKIIYRACKMIVKLLTFMPAEEH